MQSWQGLLAVQPFSTPHPWGRVKARLTYKPSVCVSAHLSTVTGAEAKRIALVIIKGKRGKTCFTNCFPKVKGCKEKDHIAWLSSVPVAGGPWEECCTLTRRIGFPSALPCLLQFFIYHKVHTKGWFRLPESQLHDVFEGDFEAQSQAQSNAF